MKTLAASVTGRAAGFNKRTEEKPKKKYEEVRQEKRSTRVHTHPKAGATVFNYSTTATVKVATHPHSDRPHRQSANFQLSGSVPSTERPLKRAVYNFLGEAKHERSYLGEAAQLLLHLRALL